MRGTTTSNAQERHFVQCRIEVARLKQQALLAQQVTATDPMQGERAGDVMDVLRSLFILPIPQEMHLLPTGSSKCVDPNVVLCVHPSYTLKGSASFSVAEQYAKKALQNKGTQVVGGTKSAGVALEIAQGSKRYAFKDAISIESPPRRVKNKVLYSSGILFGPLSKSVSKIYKAAAAANKLSKHRKGKGSVSFDPGVTKFEFGAEDLMLAEDDKSYEAYERLIELLKAKRIDEAVGMFEERNKELDIAAYTPHGSSKKAIYQSFKELIESGEYKLMPYNVKKLYFTIDENKKLAYIYDLVKFKHKTKENYITMRAKFRWDGKRWILTR